MHKLLLTGVSVIALSLGAATSAGAVDLMFPKGQGDFNWDSLQKFADAHKDLSGQTLTIWDAWNDPAGDKAQWEVVLAYFAGRRDAMIKSAGNRISPQEIEEAALGTGLVAEAVALGVPDERLGQAVHLVVRAMPGSSGSEEELPHKLMKELPNFMQPKVIHWREAMPVGPNGKLDRTGLAAELAQ